MGRTADSPESSEKSTSRRVLERFANLSLEFPVRRAPNFDTAIIRLCRKELPYWIPANSFDETVMLINFADAFLKSKLLYDLKKTQTTRKVKWRTEGVPTPNQHLRI